ncbi:pentapeptide repeat-containing protein [Rothia dentocariosa]|uniref:pentapeptide repeat-containing protein n=1 Tax=Rothia dentocariosa TaxID=2047 RepID=UPI00244B4E07|nr:pentapeptide repeat-containing protein [Rothia dentocariosa]
MSVYPKPSEELITVTIQFLPAFILGAITVIAVLCLIFRWFGLKKIRSFYVWVGALAVLGGAWAFLFPLAINADFSKNGDGAALRQMLIYTTGGVLGVITLGENHRKNSLEKAKNDQEHLRQVNAERRSRYTTAIEQLSNDKASIRLGGVYTLVGLVDEWLADEKTTPSLEERRKEGQVIINNLCAYIRSHFLLAERAEHLDEPYAKDLQKDFDGDKEKFDTDRQTFKQHKAILKEERQVRLSIIKEIRERLRSKYESVSWSDFDYDFSNAYFFYVVSFNHSYFSALLNFSKAEFTWSADFSGAKFTGNADFSGAKFPRDADQGY